MNWYWITVQIVGGVLTPVAIVFALRAIAAAVEWRAEIAQARREDQNKRYPYSKIVVHKAGNPTMFSVQFWKGDVLVHEQGAEKGAGVP